MYTLVYAVALSLTACTPANLKIHHCNWNDNLSPQNSPYSPALKIPLSK